MDVIISVFFLLSFPINLISILHAPVSHHSTLSLQTFFIHTSLRTIHFSYQVLAPIHYYYSVGIVYTV